MSGYFADSLWFQAHWYVPFLIVPAAVACWRWPAASAFFRPKGPRWADAAALLVTALLVYLTLGAALFLLALLFLTARSRDDKPRRGCYEPAALFEPCEPSSPPVARGGVASHGQDHRQRNQPRHPDQL